MEMEKNYTEFRESMLRRNSGATYKYCVVMSKYHRKDFIISAMWGGEDVTEFAW